MVKNHTFTLTPPKGGLYPDTMVIHSIRFYQLRKVTHILYKMGEVEDIPKYFESTNGDIYLSMIPPFMGKLKPNEVKRYSAKLMM